MIDIKKNLFEPEEEKKIEITGVETNICVLSNTIEIQSALQYADFTINKTLVAGKNHESQGLDILRDFNVQIIDGTKQTTDQ